MHPRLPWAPLVQHEAAQPALAALKSVTEQLVGRMDHLVGPADPGLNHGAAGLGLFFTHLSAFQPEEEWGPCLQGALDSVFEGLEGQAQALGLFEGIFGAGWFLEHLQQGTIPPDLHLNDVLDEALSTFLKPGLRTHPMEWTRGLAGMGAYALERVKVGQCEESLTHLLDRLLAASQPVHEGRTWPHPPEALPESLRREFPYGHINLGLAHGTPGILGFLGLVAQAGALAPRHRSLLEDGVSALLAAEEPDEPTSRYRRYGPWKRVGSRESTRVAWCYGDLGVSFGLLQAARGLRSQETWDRAVALAHHAATAPLEDQGARDACLCHGSIGNAHLFHRWYRATGDPAFLHRAQTWLEATWRQVPQGPHPGQFLYYRPGLREGLPAMNERDRPLTAFTLRPPRAPQVVGKQSSSTTPVPEPSWGLLQGLVGTGLGLLAAVSPQEPSWDRLLLLS